MTAPRKRNSQPQPQPQEPLEAATEIDPVDETIVIDAEEAEVSTTEPIPESGGSGDYVVYLSEEDKRLMRKFNRHIINKLGLKTSRSFRV